ncbi:hypothetical protein ALC62_02668 [Cyphomyrmex costatus]|uniref:Uncharacterized protein n=1 Tax=Cyphomyrmex costatus TaxID=456900 RepID=A0A195D0E5_9HYME|nr:hypothetical protein ALC62_02668 [Cyphomyrmex costatus]
MKKGAEVSQRKVVPCCFDVSLSDFRERRMDSSSCLPIKDLFRSCAYVVLISLEEYRENRSADQSEVKAPSDAVREIHLGVPAAGEEKPASERIHEVRDDEDASIRAKVFGESLARISLQKPHNSLVFMLKPHLVISREYTDLSDCASPPREGEGDLYRTCSALHRGVPCLTAYLSTYLPIGYIRASFINRGIPPVKHSRQHNRAAVGEPGFSRL